MLKNFVILIVFPISIMSQNCPSFRSAIKLNPSVTANNFSFAVIADGKYYLVGSEEENLKVLEPTGDMPQGFGDSRATTVIDRKLCNESQYYLISFKTSLNESNYETFYTTLDLLNWNQTTVWSQPKPISEYPLLANDPYLKLMAMLGPNFSVSNSISTMFYWEDMKTLFVVIELNAKSNSSALSGSVYRYYSIDMQNTCEENYSYSQGLKDFGSALTSVIDPLDFCFINGKLETSDPLLYCVGSISFQVNAINSRNSQNGSLQTKLIGSSDQMPSIDHLPVFGSICKSPEPVQEIGILLRIVSKRVLKLEPKKKIDSPTERRIDSSDGVHKVVIETASSTIKAKTQAKEESSSLVFIIAIICLIIVFLVFVIVLIMTARKRNSVARM